MRLFVTGTDTDVGKTVVSAALMLGLGAKYWKPIQSGPDHDTKWLQKVTGLEDERFFKERYCLSEPLSPHAAAKIDGISIPLDAFSLPDEENLIVEGAGGVMVPINEKQMVLDMIKRFALPVVVVCRSTLGTINHTLLTINCLRSFDVSVMGVVMNGPKNAGNREAIETYGKVRVLGEIEPMETIDQSALMKAFSEMSL